MNYLTGSQIRERWISFFKSKGHEFVPGVNLIPQGDKSLLWVNAGVTGLKKYFDGSEIPPCRRIVNVQKSIRTNDIENVGHTARHHTFFEMLGNFSIGDYFREEVIPWAYELLTDEKVGFGIPVERLYMTYSPLDQATKELWIKCGVPADHLIPLDGNFWEIGKGPGGPDTEMFFDRGEKYDPDHLGVKMLQKDMDNDRYIEIWNIVFSQYNCEPGVLPRSEYKELPSKNIDTGAGLERFACILQDCETNFETDLFAPLISAVKEICQKDYEGENLLSYRVIVDHARSLTFALSDGASFSNEGRGYVLRRLVRRAMRYGQKLGINEPFLFKLVKTVDEKYGDFYPELLAKGDFVAKMIRNEEEKFLKTLSSGEEKLLAMIEGKKELSGDDSFKLFDTYGFPLDLTSEICLEHGVKVDVAGFDKRMEEQKERARSARGEIDSFHKQSKDLLSFKDDSEFLYDSYEIKAKAIGLFKDGVRVDSLDEDGEIIFDKTVFYAECGGQVSDKGKAYNDSCSAKVIAVSKAPCGQHLHKIALEFGSIKEGDVLTLTIDRRKRVLTSRNHSATHLLHSALCRVLGTHVDQKGSYVDSNYLRFDFSSLEKLSLSSLKQVEKEVNEKILEGIDEITEVLPIEEAKKKGAEMEFAEKYGAMVRVVEFGDYSREFCAGTHVKNTADIGLFAIVSEGAVSSGVRRIEALTSYGAYEYLAKKKAILDEVKDKLSCLEGETLGKVASLMDNVSNANKEIASLKDKIASASAKNLSSGMESVNGVSFLAKILEKGERNDLLSLADNLKEGKKDYYLLLAGKGSKGNSLVIMAGGEGAKRLGAGAGMKLVAPLLNGNGGGKSEMASGSAKDLSAFAEAADTLKKHL
jgi:alanyl-tRNA synthetase